MPLNDFLTLLEHGGLAAIMGVLFWVEKQRLDALRDTVENDYRARIERLEKDIADCQKLLQR